MSCESLLYFLRIHRLTRLNVLNVIEALIFEQLNSFIDLFWSFNMYLTDPHPPSKQKDVIVTRKGYLNLDTPLPPGPCAYLCMTPCSFRECRLLQDENALAAALSSTNPDLFSSATDGRSLRNTLTSSGTTLSNIYQQKNILFYIINNHLSLE